MKTILCYGDSNTWGYMPGTQGRRYGAETRWPGVMSRELGGGYRVIEEALNGRTTSYDDPVKDGRNGASMLPWVLESHAPIDLVILMLGTNDLKHHLGLTAWDLALGMGRLVEVVKGAGCGPWVDGVSAVGGVPRVLVASPAIPTASGSRRPVDKFVDAAERAEGLAGAYRRVAEAMGCGFVDVDGLVRLPEPDGVHLDEAGHGAVGKAMAVAVRGMVG